MKKVIAGCLMLLGLSGCVVPAGSYEEPYPGYAGGEAYDAYPYSYYYGSYGVYPSRHDYHRNYNWGYWQGDGRWHGHYDKGHQPGAHAGHGAWHGHARGSNGGRVGGHR